MPVSAPKSGASARRSGREPTPTGQPPASATQAQSISPIGPRPITATVSPAETPACLDAVEAAGERLDHRRDLGRHAGRDGEEVRARDALRHEDELGVGAVEEREEVLAEGLLAAQARWARAAGGGVGSDDAAAGGGVDAAELVPERARRRPEQHGVAAAEGLQVGAVGERDLDLHEHVAVGGRLGPRHVLEPQVAGAVEDERSHGHSAPAPG